MPVRWVLLLVTVAHAWASSATVDVSDEAGLMAALSTASVSVIRLKKDIALTKEALIPGALAASGVYELTRNVSITAIHVTPADWYPKLDFTWAGSARLRVMGGVRVTLQHLTIVENARSYGWKVDFFDDQSLGIIDSFDSLHVMGACVPFDTAEELLRLIPRPPGYPGVQTSMVLTSGWCAPMEPDSLISGRCWSQVFHIQDAMLQGKALSVYVYAQNDAEYIYHLRNSSWLCDQMLSTACVEKHGVLNCTKIVLSGHMPTNDGGGAPPTSPPPRATPPSVPPPPAAVLPPTVLPPFAPLDGRTPVFPLMSGVQPWSLPSLPLAPPPAAMVSSGGTAPGVIVGAAVGSVVATVLIVTALSLLVIRRRAAGGTLKTWWSASSSKSTDPDGGGARSGASQGSGLVLLASQESRAGSLQRGGAQDSRAGSLQRGEHDSRAGSLQRAGGQDSRAGSLQHGGGQESRAGSLQRGGGQDSRAGSLQRGGGGQEDGPSNRRGHELGEGGEDGSVPPAAMHGVAAAQGGAGGPAGEAAGSDSVLTSFANRSGRHHPMNDLHELSSSLQTSLQNNQLVIQDVIGSGAFGTVYRGCWQGLPVAVKTQVFSGHSLGAPGGASNHRLLMEAALSKSITHPNVVATYSCDIKPLSTLDAVLADYSTLRISTENVALDDWRLYIIQEFCDGGSLRDVLESRCLAAKESSPTLDVAAALSLAVGIASGMAHLHELNIIHGDLNPANVLLKLAGGALASAATSDQPLSSVQLAARLTPKVCDFGFSVRLPDDRTHVSNTRHGTPFYMAPEVSQHGNLSKAADVYAIGIILWELYMGTPVWEIDSTGKMGLRRSFPLLPPEAPPRYRQLAGQCIQLNHTRRPTINDVHQQVLEMQQEARRPAPPYAMPLRHASVTITIDDDRGSGGGAKGGCVGGDRISGGGGSGVSRTPSDAASGGGSGGASATLPTARSWSSGSLTMGESSQGPQMIDRIKAVPRSKHHNPHAPPPLPPGVPPHKHRPLARPLAAVLEGSNNLCSDDSSSSHHHHHHNNSGCSSNNRNHHRSSSISDDDDRNSNSNHKSSPLWPTSTSSSASSKGGRATDAASLFGSWCPPFASSTGCSASAGAASQSDQQASLSPSSGDHSTCPPHLGDGGGPANGGWGGGFPPCDRLTPPPHRRSNLAPAAHTAATAATAPVTPHRMATTPPLTATAAAAASSTDTALSVAVTATSDTSADDPPRMALFEAVDDGAGAGVSMMPPLFYSPFEQFLAPPSGLASVSSACRSLRGAGDPLPAIVE